MKRAHVPPVRLRLFLRRLVGGALVVMPSAVKVFLRARPIANASSSFG